MKLNRSIQLDSRGIYPGSIYEFYWVVTEYPGSKKNLLVNWSTAPQ